MRKYEPASTCFLCPMKTLPFMKFRSRPGLYLSRGLSSSLGPGTEQTQASSRWWPSSSSLQVREAEGRRAEEQLAQTAPEVPTILVYPVSTFSFSGATPTSTTCRAASPS